MSSLAEIRQAIEKLAANERAELRQWLDAQDIEESPEFLDAVDKGIWSAENEPVSGITGLLATNKAGKRNPHPPDALAFCLRYSA